MRPAVLLLSVFSGALWLFVSRAIAAEPFGRWAVLVGVDDYVSLEKLRFCGEDMRALRGQLVRSGFPEKQLFLLDDAAKETKRRPMKANIDRQLDLVLQLVAPEDLVVVAFSGHGVHLDGKSYLCPAEARLEDISTLIPLETVYQRLEKSQASLKLLLVDACRDDPRPRGARSAGTAPDGTKFSNDLEHPPEGILLIASCSPGQVSREDEKLRHGVFMHYVLDGLKGPADVDQNRRVSLLELYKYANRQTKTHVARQFNDFQVPALKGEISDDFDLAKVTEELEKRLRNSIGMEFRLIPAGEFLMGRQESVESLCAGFEWTPSDRFDDEAPAHKVKIGHEFYMGAHEVTVGSFRQFTQETSYVTDAERDSNGSHTFLNSEGKFEQRSDLSWRHPGIPQTDSHPVVHVSWKDATAFCKWLSGKENAKYRLPTEAEWEYACRAGTTARFWNSDDVNRLTEVANCRDGTLKDTFADWDAIVQGRDGYVYTSPVGSFKPNAFGLYDVHGNVWEFCSDWYDAAYYGKSPLVDPTGPASGTRHVIRGGCFY